MLVQKEARQEAGSRGLALVDAGERMQRLDASRAPWLREQGKATESQGKPRSTGSWQSTPAATSFGGEARSGHDDGGAEGEAGEGA